MDCQRPVKNKETNKWEVWDFAYVENNERMYELHEFFSPKEAIEFWKLRNPKKEYYLQRYYKNSRRFEPLNFGNRKS